MDISTRATETAMNSVSTSTPVEANDEGISDAPVPDAPQPEQLLPALGGSQAQQLVVLADSAVLFHTPEQHSYATVPVGNHLEHHAIRSSPFEQWLRRSYFQTYRGVPNAQALKDALDALDARAQFEGHEHPVFTRIAGHDRKIYIDCCDADWRVIEIGSSGWSYVERPPVRFRRTSTMSALPEPVREGDVEELRRFLNVDTNGWRLIASWLSFAFHPTGPYPLLLLSGEQGTAKSTTARILRSLIDPSTSPLREAPRNSQDLMITANNCWLPTFDNLSSIRADMSDALCRLSTGGGFASRKLYTNDDEVVLDAMRPVIITGIGNLATRADLADRAVRVTLRPISNGQRRSEDEFWAEFEEVRPCILSGLLSVVVAAQHRLPTVTLASLPRMADFAKWSAAAAPAIGWNAYDFLEAYNEQLTNSMDSVLDDSLVGQAVIELMKQHSDRYWSATPTETLTTLRGMADSRMVNFRTFPSMASRMTEELNRVAPVLRSLGIDVLTGIKKEGKRQIVFKKLDNFASSAS